MTSRPERTWLASEGGARPDGQEGSFSKRDVAFVLFSRMRSILLVAAAFVAGIALAVFWLISPTFESKARVHIDIQSGSLPTLRASGMYVSDAEKLAYFETVIQEMKNEALVEAVVRELELGERRVIGTVERIKNALLDARRRVGMALGIASWSEPRDPAAASMEAVLSGLAVNRLENSTILELVYQAKDPREAERTLATLIRRFVESRNLFTREKATGSSEFLAQEIERLRADIGRAEGEWLELVKRDVYRMPADVLGGSSARGTLSITGLSTNDAVIEEMKLHAIKLQEELQATLARYSESDPNVRRLRQMIRSYADVINAAPEAQTRIRRLKREVASKEGVYRELLTAYENALAMESQGVGRLSAIKVVQAPRVPGSSVKPKRTLALAAGVLLGLFFGVLLAFVAEFFDDTVKRPADAERLLGLRCICSVPRV